jgi:hypothetical protein
MKVVILSEPTSKDLQTQINKYIKKEYTPKYVSYKVTLTEYNIIMEKEDDEKQN